MPKKKYFKFYSADFLVGVSGLSFEERGQYVTLLSLQHQKGELSEKTINEEIGIPSAHVMDKFIKLKNGNFVNKRLQKELSIKKLDFKKNKNTVKNKKFDFKDFFVSKGFDADLVSEYEYIRIEKRGIQTKRAAINVIDNIEITAQKHNLHINQVLKYIVEKQWCGFKAKWYDEDNDNKTINHGKDNYRNNQAKYGAIASEWARSIKEKYNS